MNHYVMPLAFLCIEPNLIQSKANTFSCVMHLTWKTMSFFTWIQKKYLYQDMFHFMNSYFFTKQLQHKYMGISSHLRLKTLTTTTYHKLWSKFLNSNNSFTYFYRHYQSWHFFHTNQNTFKSNTSSFLFA